MAKFIMPEALKGAPDAETIEKLGQAIVGSIEAIDQEKLDKMLAEYASKGVSKETVEKIEKALEDQGATLTKMQEAGKATDRKGNYMEKEFYRRFEEIKDVLNSSGAKPGITIKAVDEHNSARIETTGTAITSTDDSFMPENVKDGGTFLNRWGRQFIRAIANVSNVGTVPEAVTFMDEGTEQGTFAIVAENGLKPQQFLTLVKSTIFQKKVAGYIVATEELIRNRRRAWAAIMRMFRNKFERNYDAILYDTFSGSASAYVSTPLDGTIENPQDVHALVAAMAQIESLNFVPDTLVINPADKWRLALNTTPSGSQYLFLPSLLAGQPIQPLGLNVITSTEIAAGTFLLGESGTFEIEESGVELRIGYVNDDHIHNRRTFVLERYFIAWLPENLKGSWVSGNFADIKEQLAVTP
jgi:hypothetical protein